jgi:hypothetical protein
MAESWETLYKGILHDLKACKYYLYIVFHSYEIYLLSFRFMYPREHNT